MCMHVWYACVFMYVCTYRMYACVCKYVCMYGKLVYVWYACVCMYVGVFVATRLAFKNKQNYVNGNR